MIKSKFIPLSEWDQSIMDSVLLEGSQFYEQIINIRNMRFIYLCYEDLIGTFDIMDHTFHIDKFIMFPDRFEPEFTNVDGISNHLDFVYDGEFNFQSIHAQLQMFKSSKCEYALFLYNQYTYGIIKQHDYIYFFDSHAKLFNGEISSDGTASLRSFGTIKTLCNYIIKINNFRSTTYQMVYLNICENNIFDTVKSNSKLTKSFSTMSIEEDISLKSSMLLII